MIERVLYRNEKQLNPNSLLEKLSKYDFLNHEEIAQLEFRELKSVLEHSNKTVPYYKNLFLKANFDPSQMKSVSDIQRIPFLEKGVLFQQTNDLLSGIYNFNNLQRLQTGGSTGEPLVLFADAFENTMHSSFNWSQWQRLNIKPGVRSLHAHGMSHVDYPQTVHLSQKEDDPILTLHRPALDLAPQWNEIVEKISAHKPILLYGFPSVISELAHFVLENRIQSLISIKHISLSSEDILPQQRQLIEAAFQTPCYGFYGQTERCVLAMNCEKSQSYHLYPGYAYIELIDEAGEIITKPGVMGEVVGTSFVNYAMPFIRYRTGDLATWEAVPCECGRSHKRFAELKGRKRSRVYFPDGTSAFFGSDLYDDLWKIETHFRQIQFVQTNKESLDVRVVAFKNTSQKQLKDNIEKIMKKTLGRELALNVHFVDGVERSPRGKSLLFIQKISHS